jgi:hypothetical protein
VRYFHQPKQYWLDNCTLHDWREIYQRELTEMPPAEHFLAAYFDYDPPVIDASSESSEEVVFDVSECEA